MKYTNISIEGNTYTLIKTPNWLEKLFGYKKKKIEYYDDGSVFVHFTDTTCFFNKKTGKKLSFSSKETELLNNYKRKLNWT